MEAVLESPFLTHEQPKPVEFLKPEQTTPAREIREEFTDPPVVAEHFYPRLKDPVALGCLEAIRRDEKSAFVVESLRSGEHMAQMKLALTTEAQKMLCRRYKVAELGPEHAGIIRDVNELIDELHREGQVQRLGEYVGAKLGKNETETREFTTALSVVSQEARAYFLAEMDQFERGTIEALSDREHDAGFLELKRVLEAHGVDGNALKKQPLLAEYLHATMTGKSSMLREATLGRLERLAAKRPESVTFMVQESDPRFEFGINEDKANFGGEAVVSTSLEALYGSKSAVFGFLREQMVARDTLPGFVVPLEKGEHDTLARQLASGDAYQTHEAQTFLLGQIRRATELVVGNHGFGGKKELWQRIMGQLLATQTSDGRFGLDGRPIGLVMATKGADGTVWECADKDLPPRVGKRKHEGGRSTYRSGRMDDGSMAEITTLEALGEVGRDMDKRVTAIGHSMGGLQELIDVVTAKQEYQDFRTIAVTPVYDNDPASLLLFGGGKDHRSTWGTLNNIQSQFPLHQVAVSAGKMTGLNTMATRGLIVTGRFEGQDKARLTWVADIHRDGLGETEYLAGERHGLAEVETVKKADLRAIQTMRGERVAGVIVGGADEILEPNREEQTLTETGWGNKLWKFPDIGHYAQFTEQGFTGVAVMLAGLKQEAYGKVPSMDQYKARYQAVRQKMGKA